MEDVLPDDTVWDLFFRKTGHLWARTAKGFAVYDGNVWAYPNLRTKVGCPVGDILESRHGDLWIAGSGEAIRNPELRFSHVNPTKCGLFAVQKKIESRYPNVDITRHVARDSGHRKSGLGGGC